MDYAIGAVVSLVGLVFGFTSALAAIRMIRR
jgi:hypothetical protein